MTLNLTTLNSRTSITNNPPPAAPACGLNETGICCKESETAHVRTSLGFVDHLASLTRDTSGGNPQNAPRASSVYRLGEQSGVALALRHA
jgi:hypothetical protein